MKQQTYISGKITGMPETAYELFGIAEIELHNIGRVGINPMKEVPLNESFLWSDYMLKDIEILFNCDAIYMLRNWGQSKGSRIERAIAIELGLEIIYQK